MKKFLILLLSLVFLFSCSAFAVGCKEKTKTPASTEEPGKTDDPSDPGEDPGDDDDPPVVEKLEITGPEDGVYGYTQKLRNYLTATGDDVKVSDYATESGEDEAYDKIQIKWESNLENVEEYEIEFGLKDDFSDAEKQTMSATSRKLNVYNLYKDSTYNVRVTAVRKAGNKSATATFKTTDIGPRVMKIGGLCNVRDLGGYKTESGKTTVQGKIFRGGQLSQNANWSVYDNIVLNAAGKKYMSEVLGVKTDFDLRSQAENKGLTESPIPNARLEYYNVGGYLSAFTDAAGYKKVFSALADETRYPVYIHCTGGADRTGTVSFLINALLGVDEKTLIQDYEITSFSAFGMRNKESTTYQFTPFMNKLKSDYEGDTLSKKVENYLLSIGVTETEIYNIKAIMFGEPTRDLPAPPETVTLDSDNLTYTYDGVAGYGKTFNFDVQSLTYADGNNDGGTYFMIGSYGVYFRGGLFRLAYNNGGVFAEPAKRVELSTYDHTKFNAGVKLGIEITIKNETTVTIKLYINGESLGQEVDVARLTDEIPSDEANAVVRINQSYVKEIVLIKG